MPLPSSGPLSLADIQAEFGGSNPISLSEYYAGGGRVPAGTSGTHGPVPSSGAISIRNFYGTSNVTYRLDAASYTDFVLSPSNAGVTFSVNSDGSLQAASFSAGSLASYNWITPTATASSHYVRATLNSGAFTSGSTGTWLALTSNHVWEVAQFSPGVASAEATFAIATDAAGTNIVASANVFLQATVDL